MSAEENIELGTVTKVRFSVRSVTDLKPISSTVPCMSPKRHQSPGRMGLAVYSVIAPMTFSSVFCAASATANEPTPRPAISVDTLKPAWSAHISAAVVATMMRTMTTTGLISATYSTSP